VLYPYLVYGGWGQPIATLVLEARNALLVLLAWRACAEVWRRVRPEPVSAPGTEPILR
jgi:hypothetical protein